MPQPTSDFQPTRTDAPPWRLTSTVTDSLLLHLLLWATLVALAAMVSGCQGTDEQEPEAVGQPPGAAATDRPGPSVATSTSEVEVRLHDRLIEMPSSLPAGPTVFTVANTGAMVHGFEIEGVGLERAIERIEPDATETLTVDLAPGTYTVYCPVDNHRGEGMETELRVIE